MLSTDWYEINRVATRIYHKKYEGGKNVGSGLTRAVESVRNG